MVVKDCQPFSIVEDVGFKRFVSLLDPNYILPSRKALKTMVATKFKKEKEKAKEERKKATAVGLTFDMWTSIHMDAYLAVTCHFVDSKDKLESFLLTVVKFPESHHAIMEEWGIQSKVACMVTDGAANIVACVNSLRLRRCAPIWLP